MDISILFEDDNYIIFNKPSGLVVHPDGRQKAASDLKEAAAPFTLADWLVENRPDMKNVGEPLEVSSANASSGDEKGGAEKTEKAVKTEKILRPGIVHRLDKDTSGTIAVAKNQKAFDDLKKKFQDREVDKKYHTFVYGNLPEDDATINRPIGRSKSDFRLWSAQRGARGEMRDAITNYRVMKRGSDDSAEHALAVVGRHGQDTGETKPQPVTFVEVEPKTGRTHQIRVHFKSIHHPVIADILYAPKMPMLLGFERLALHSISIAFTGIDGKKIRATAPYPADFERALTLFKENQ